MAATLIADDTLSVASIIRYSFNDLGRMEDWHDLAARVYRKICWYDLNGESNPSQTHGSTIVYYATAATVCTPYLQMQVQGKKKCKFKNVIELSISVKTVYMVILFS